MSWEGGGGLEKKMGDKVDKRGRGSWCRERERTTTTSVASSAAAVFAFRLSRSGCVVGGRGVLKEGIRLCEEKRGGRRCGSFSIRGGRERERGSCSRANTMGKESVDEGLFPVPHGFTWSSFHLSGTFCKRAKISVEREQRE